MSRSVNKQILIGNLGGEPESRYTTSGSPVANFSIATGYTRRGPTGENETTTEWHRCVAFGSLAEIATQYLHKGSKVYVEGRTQTRKWEDNNGVSRETKEVVVNELTLLDRATDGASGGGTADGSAVLAYAQATPQIENEDFTWTPNGTNA